MEEGMTDRGTMRQEAPWPHALANLVECLQYRRGEGWRIWLEDTDRGQGSKGLTLVVLRSGPDSYHPDTNIRVHHYFPVPPAAYDWRSWRRWLLDRLGDVDTHERCENFIVADSPGSYHVMRPYAPSHGDGNDPYLVRELGTAEDQRTSFRNVLDDDGTGRRRGGD
jgi:hypothetical protein